MPQLWHYEMRNLLLMAIRESADVGRGRRQARRGSRDPPLARRTARRTSTATFALAEKHELTFYDGLYLELACRRGAALATADRRLLAAARAEGVAWD